MQQLTDVIKRHIIDALADTHTSTIGRVTKVNTTTLELESVTRMTYKGEDIPLIAFSQVPPVFMQGGASYTAHPIAIGDYALIVFAERAFDRWYSGVDGVRPPELRMHDYSDGFAIVGINPAGGAITIPSITQEQGDINHDGNRTQTGDHTQTGAISLTGDMEVIGQATITDVVFGSIQTSGLTGVSGSFTSADSKTITVTNGIITGIA